LSAVFNLLPASMNLKQLCNQSSQYENFFISTSCAATESTLLAVSKDEWNAKEDYEECILCTVVCQKAPFGKVPLIVIACNAQAVCDYKETSCNT